MFSDDQYELLDFGHGRKLERFGQVILDRPAPIARRSPRAGPALWESADARFQRIDSQHGHWESLADRKEPIDRWTIRHGQVVLELRLTDSGAVGVYPEQAENWDWLARQVGRAEGPVRVLNLFAYTGGSTLAAAAAGAEVTHVDSARSVVTWARKSASLSNLADAPVRWIIEDVRKFVCREHQRGRRYDALVLDPPTYGHGVKGQPWRIDHDLMPLLRACQRLLSERPVFLLLTCHARQIGQADLEAMAADALFGHCGSGVRSRELPLRTRDRRQLACGIAARWPT